MNETLPYGVFSTKDNEPRAGVHLDEGILDLHAAARKGIFRQALPEATCIFACPTLNRFLTCGRPAWHAVRERLLQLARDKGLHDFLVPEKETHVHMPIDAGDYVDFYSSIEHASNVGKLFRPGGDPLTPNYRHMPIGYHGRSSTITIGETIRRPSGQRKDANASAPEFGPSRQLDFELEVGFIVGALQHDGAPIAPDAAGDYLFGVVLLSDWSARDLQAWEGQPLGPFLSKSFATTISPWIVPLDALAPYRVSNRVQDPQPLPYLRGREPWAFDIELSVALQTARMRGEHAEAETIAHVNFRNMYWNAAQQLAHLTSNGSIVRAGDLLGSGTVSGIEPGTFGSLLEATQRGAQPLVLANGERRTFLEDGDTIVMRGLAERAGLPRITLGELRTTLLPAQGRAAGGLE